MASKPTELQQTVRFGEGYELDLRLRRLRRGRYLIRMERIPLEILILLVEHQDEIVNRDEIVSRVWGKGVFFDTDNSIRGAIRKLRQALKDDAGSPRFIQTVTGQGYRFIAPVTVQEEVNGTDASAVETSTVRTSPPAPVLDFDTPSAPVADQRSPAIGELTGTQQAGPNRHARRWLFAGSVLLLALVAFAAYDLVRTRAPAAKYSKIASIAVMPLKNLSGDPAQEYLADGMTEELIGRLSAIRDLHVTSRTSVMRFKDTQLGLSEIAKDLGVDAIVEGSVMREGSRVRVHAQLIRATSDQHIWSESYERELRSVFTLESDVAQAIAEKVKVTVSGDEHSRLVASRDVAPEVYESYMHGVSLKSDNRADVEESIRYFEQAIKDDRSFAPAYVGLAGAYASLESVLVGGAPPIEFRPKVIETARKALDLDPDLVEAHDVLADAYKKEFQWSEAENEIRTVLHLRPNDASAHLGFAQLSLSQGQFDEAIAWAKRGRELDPFSVSGADLAWILFQARRYDEAERELRAELAVQPEDSWALWCLGFVLIAEQRAPEAIPVLERGVRLSHGSPGIIGVLIRAYAKAGRRKDALRQLDELKRRRVKSYVPAAAFIQAYVGLSDNDQAIAWLNRGYEERSAIMQWLKVEPTFDPLRGDPRFQELVRRVGLN